MGTSWLSKPGWPTAGAQKVPVVVRLSWPQWRQQCPSNGCVGSADGGDGWQWRADGEESRAGTLGGEVAAQGRVLVLRRVQIAASVTAAFGVLTASEDKGG